MMLKGVLQESIFLWKGDCQQCFSKLQDGWNCCMLLLIVFFEGDKLDWMFWHAVTDSMDQNPSSEADGHSASREISKPLWNLYVHIHGLTLFCLQNISSISELVCTVLTFCLIEICVSLWECYCVQEPPTQEEKDCYLKKAAEFAASLAASLEDPNACRLYCPAFKSSACECLQKYITENGNEVFLLCEILGC